MGRGGEEERSGFQIRSTDFESRIAQLEDALQSVNATTLSRDVNHLKEMLGMEFGLPSQFHAADCAFMMACFVFTMMMTLPGLALFYGGLVRARAISLSLSLSLTLSLSRARALSLPPSLFPPLPLSLHT